MPINRSKLYNLIYKKADKIFKQHNPCNIKHTDGNTTCSNIMYNPIRYNTLCCGYCDSKYWDNGCTIKCLKCKLYLCSTLKRKYRKTDWYKQLRKLELIAKRYMLIPDYFLTKKSSLARTNRYYRQYKKYEYSYVRGRKEQRQALKRELAYY